jgi:hypothetical protein
MYEVKREPGGLPYHCTDGCACDGAMHRSHLRNQSGIGRGALCAPAAETRAHQGTVWIPHVRRPTRADCPAGCAGEGVVNRPRVRNQSGIGRGALCAPAAGTRARDGTGWKLHVRG